MTMLGAVADTLKRRGSEGWLVGGSVRDRLLGRFSPDLDVVVADDAATVAKQLASAMRAPWFALSDRYPTFRVLGPDGHVDVASVRGEGILADLAQRDFTVNAMAVLLAAIVAAEATLEGESSTLVDAALDPYGGAEHLAKGRLVAVSEHIFSDDPLRLMRAPRFCHTLGFTLDEDLSRMVRAQASQVGKAAVERVVNEMCLTLAGGRASAAVWLWAGLGLLTEVLPELAGPETEPGGRVAAATAVLDCLDGHLGRLAELFPDSAPLLIDRLAEPVDGAMTRPVALRLAALLCGPDSEQVRRAGRRLKLSSALVALLVAAARGAAVAGSAAGLAQLLPKGETTGRAAVTFLWDAAPWEPEVVLLAAAVEQVGDAAAGRPGAAQSVDSSDAARRLMALAVARAGGEQAPCPVDGEILMRELGLTGGPALGRALREAQMAWEAGEAKTEAEVLAVARAVVS